MVNELLCGVKTKSIKLLEKALKRISSVNHRMDDFVLITVTEVKQLITNHIKTMQQKHGKYVKLIQINNFHI